MKMEGKGKVVSFFTVFSEIKGREELWTSVNAWGNPVTGFHRVS